MYEFPPDEGTAVEEAQPEPASPVAENIVFYERIGSAQPEPLNDEVVDAWPSRRGTRKRKGRRSRGPTSPPPVDPESVNGSTINGVELCINAKMYALADKYDIPDLKGLARQKFKRNVADGWNTPGFASAAEIVYESTPKADNGLREVVVNTLDRHRELADKGEIEKLLDSGNGLALALLKVAWKNSDRPYDY